MTAAATSAIPVLDTSETFTPLVMALNINSMPGEPVIMFTDSAGAFYLSRETLAELRIRAGGVKVTTIEGAPYVQLEQLSGVNARVDNASQKIELSVPAELFETTTVSFQQDDPGVMTPARPGFLFNYELLGQYGAGPATLNGAFELGIFSGASFVQTTATASWAGGGPAATRLASSRTVEDRVRMRSLSAGDSIPSGGFGGLRLRSAGFRWGGHRGGMRAGK